MAFLSRLLALEPMLVALRTRLRFLPPTLARLTLGWVFLLSGWGKLHHLDDVIEFFRSIGIPAPQLQAPFASGVEFVCGALLLAGLFSRLASVPLVVVMIVAIATARHEELTSLGDLFGFIEYLYIVLLSYVAIEGPGPLSIDALLGGRRASFSPARRAATVQA
ncbi:MAG TPA: DoxX family protein [Candidatus Polarisedimenticolia bacterium]|jgi:putative oxidoreductase|nr:DoxX family protein [Candidatus Polarisedimenticolia bacterium]